MYSTPKNTQTRNLERTFKTASRNEVFTFCRRRTVKGCNMSTFTPRSHLLMT